MAQRRFRNRLAVAVVGGLIAGLAAVAAVSAPASAQDSATFPGTLSESDPTFHRPDVGSPPTDHLNADYRYDLYAFTPTTTGLYRITEVATAASPIDPFVCLYVGPLAPDPLVHVVACDSQFDLALNGGQTYLVLATSGFPTSSAPGLGGYQVTIAPVPPTVTIHPRSVSEVDTGDGNPGQSIEVSIDTAQAADTVVSLTHAADDGELHGTDTARGGVDYTSTANSVVIPQGQTSAFLGIRVFGDTVDELDETVTFTSSSAQVGSGPEFDPAASAVVTITDDDAAPFFALDAGATTETNSGSPGHPVDVTVGGGSPGVTYHALAGDVPCGPGIEAATAGVDYQSFGPAFITVPGSFVINILGDTAFEPTEFVCLSGGPVYAVFGSGGDFSTNPPTGLPADTVTYPASDVTADVLPIFNDDAPPAVSATLSPATLSVDEGAAAPLTVRFSPATALPTTIGWEAVDGTDVAKFRAVAGQDFTGGPHTLVVPTGTTTATITVPTLTDRIDEADERFGVRLTGSSTVGVTIGAAATSTVTIRANRSGATPVPPVVFPPVLPFPRR